MKSILLTPLSLLDSNIFKESNLHLAIIPHQNKEEVNSKKEFKNFVYIEIKHCKFSVYCIPFLKLKHLFSNGFQYVLS